MSTPIRVLVPLADGFEEIEAVTLIDVLRRAGLDVLVAGLSEGPVNGSHGIVVQPDMSLDAVDAGSIGVLALPGGMPGTTRLAEDERILALARRLHAGGQLVAAICAAPLVLAAAELLDGVQVTAHPSVRDQLGAADVQARPRVIANQGFMTSQGPGTSLEFALALVRALRGPEVARELAAAMLAGEECSALLGPPT